MKRLSFAHGLKSFNTLITLKVFQIYEIEFGNQMTFVERYLFIRHIHIYKLVEVVIIFQVELNPQSNRLRCLRNLQKVRTSVANC